MRRGLERKAQGAQFAFRLGERLVQLRELKTISGNVANPHDRAAGHRLTDRSRDDASTTADRGHGESLAPFEEPLRSLFDQSRRVGLRATRPGQDGAIPKARPRQRSRSPVDRRLRVRAVPGDQNLRLASRESVLDRSSFAVVRASSASSSFTFRIQDLLRGYVRCGRDRGEQQQQDQNSEGEAGGIGLERRRPGRRQAAHPSARPARPAATRSRTAAARAAAARPNPRVRPPNRTNTRVLNPRTAEPPREPAIRRCAFEGAADRRALRQEAPNQPPTGLRKVWRKVVNHDEESEIACLSLKAEASRPEAFGRAERANPEPGLGRDAHLAHAWTRRRVDAAG